jgi:hypothetical protein
MLIENFDSGTKAYKTELEEILKVNTIQDKENLYC